MSKSYNSFALLLTVSLGGLTPTCSAFAQNVIIPDSTLGTEGSQVTPLDSTTDLIEGGAIRDTNLFHSFQDFNIDEGLQVYFDNPTGIDNILSRVTGSNPSDIFGMLGVQGPANLFFINPNGIVFGPSASLDVEGSFLATTADSVRFSDGYAFNTSNAASTSVLSIGVPLGLQYGPNAVSATIENTGSLAAGQDLTLAAGNLDLQGQIQANENLTLQATDTVKIRNTTESPFITAAGEQLLVQGDKNVDIFALNHSESGLFSGGDMVLRSANPIGGDAHYWSGGSFRTEDLDGNIGGLYSSYDPVIRSLGDVNIGDYVGNSLHVLAGGSITLRTATIQSAEVDSIGADSLQETVELSDGTQVDIDGSAQPTLDLRAGVSSTAIGEPSLPKTMGFNPLADNNKDSSAEAMRADITVGNAFFPMPNSLLLLTNQYQSDSESTNGSIFVVGEDAPLSPRGINLVTVLGDSGDIFIDSRDDIVVTDSLITTGALSNAGDIFLLAEDTIRMENIRAENESNQKLLTGVASSTIGGESSGGIRIAATNLEMINGAQIVTSVANFEDLEDTLANQGIELEDIRFLLKVLGIDTDNPSSLYGIAGDIDINVSEKASFEGIATVDGENFSGGIFSRIQSTSQGASADIRIAANELEVSNSAQIRTVIDGTGEAGDIVIEIVDTAIFDGFSVSNGEEIPSAAISNVQPGGNGTAGSISITANNLEVINGAELDATSDGTAGAGDIGLTVNEALLLDNGTVSTMAEAASGGMIRVVADRVRLYRDSDISTFVAQGEGGGGNIDVTADSVVAFDDSDILAFAQDGKGGNVELNTPAFFGENYQPAPAGINPRTLDGNGRVDVNADGAIAGTISVPDVSFIQDDLTDLPDNIINTNQLIAGSCIARREGSGSFIVSGGGGLPDQPGDSAIAIYPIGDINRFGEDLTDLESTDHQANEPIVEPQGIFQLADGRIIMSRNCEGS